MNDLLNARALLRELADRDDHLLLDIGLVRAADGSLCRSDAPSELATPTAAAPRAELMPVLARVFAFPSDLLRDLVAAARVVPFHSSASGPVILSH
jgi:uncharacterized protein YjiS (DUF1127 family)